MNIFKKIKPIYFFVSFAIGLLVVYLITPPPQVVVKFPSPFNAGQVVYKDKADQCFVYRADKSTCPADKALIKEQPIQL